MNPWLMGLLAAAVSALAGAGATSWWDSEPDEADMLLAGAELPDDAEDAAERPWLTRRAPPEINVVHPLAAFDDQELERLTLLDPTALGSMSIGAPNRGALINSVQLPDSPLWAKADPQHAWGTRETIEFVEHAVTRVNEEFPGTPLLYVGDVSARSGGRLKPHMSHQSGRDVDIGYYYLNDSAWYRRATAGNLDRARTWVLLETLLNETRVEYVFIDRSLQPLLKEYALAHGEDPEWLSRVFEGSSGKKDSIVRHRWGHATHMHVRFENPTAELTARRAQPWLRDAGLMGGPPKRPKGARGQRKALRQK